MELGLKGKKAVILGGTRGIGRAIVENLIKEGVNIALCARNPEQVAACIKELSGKGVTVIGEAINISNGEALKSWVCSAGEELGGIDILISNASAMTQGSSEEDWKAGLSIDILGLMNATEAAKPFLEKSAIENGDASIISIGSVSSVNASAPSAYGAIKGALVHYIKGLAKENAAKHIRANVVSPGTVYFKGGVWHMIEENMPDVFAATMKRNPTGRMATPEDIANATVFLASPLSSFTTGINFIVDGAITDRANY
ncbi:MAG: 3-oxoacyl-[acyl-carrier protein] reductase [Oceanicoccus sp.]|jgi:3-oxoacyl-[acyl-carrier protein] reductase